MFESKVQKSINAVKDAGEVLRVKEPFFGYLFYSLKLQNIDDWKDTQMVMGTDGKRLCFRSDWVLGLPQIELVGILAHEMMHIALYHNIRRGDRNDNMWNVACDLVVNRVLRQRGYRLPADGLADQIPCQVYDHDTTEDVYERLKQMFGEEGETCPQAGKAGGVMDRPSPGQGQGDQPSEEDGNGPPENGKGRGQSGGQDAEIDAQRDVAKALQQAKGIGKMPGDIERLIKLEGESRKDWREEIRRYMGGGAEKAPTWARPNRRYIHDGTYLPGGEPHGVGEIACIIDVSGSVDDALVNKYLTEVAKIKTDLIPDRLHIILCDARVQATYTFGAFENMGNIKVVGRGGTNMTPAFEWIRDNGIEPSALVVLTDMEIPGGGWGEPVGGGCETLWICWPGGDTTAKPPHGRVLMM